MTTMLEMVRRLRPLLQGGQSEDLSELAQPYEAGSGVMVMRYPKKNLAEGSMLSAGLVTFHVFETNSDNVTVRGVAGTDGSPDVDLPTGTLVRIRPQHSTFAMFDAINTAIDSISQPTMGLFSVASYAPTEVNREDGVYTLPDFPAPPIRLVSTRWRLVGTEKTEYTGNAEWIPQDGVVKVNGPLPWADQVEFLFACPFIRAATLDDVMLTDCLIDPVTENIVLLGAAASLALSNESRRVSLFAQGDSRRAEEVREGANIGVARMYSAEFQAAVDAEYTRLTRLWPIMKSGHPMFDQTSPRWTR